MRHSTCHTHMTFEGPEFGDTHADDCDQCGEPGKEAEGEQEAAEELGEDDQCQGDAVAKMKGVGEYILQVAEVLEFIEAIIEAEDQPKGYTQNQEGDVEGAFGILGGKEFLHVCFSI